MKILGLFLLSVIAFSVYAIARDMAPAKPEDSFKQPPGFRR